MATNHTSNYQLNQWEPTDQVLRTDFNQDNAKVDTALKGLSTSMQQASTQLSQISQQLTMRGNCQVVSMTYVGTGEETATLIFDHKPIALFFYDPVDYLFMIAIQGCGNALCATSNAGKINYFTWSGKTVSWRSVSNAAFQCNVSGRTYYVAALLDLSA